MRILHLIDGLDVGGAERLLADLVERLDRASFELRVASLGGPGALGARLTAAGVEVLDLSAPRGAWPARWVGFLRSKVVRDADVLHAHLARSMVVGRMLRNVGWVRRLVTTQHFPPDEGGRRRRALLRIGAGDDDRTVAVSDAIARELVAWGADPARVSTIPNGIDLARFEGIGRSPGSGSGPPTVGAVASLTRKKGLDVLLHALAAVPDARLVVAGEGPERGRLEALVRELGLAERVELRGVVDDVPALLAELDVFCLPSRREPYGLALAEALSAGVPCVASAVGGPAELCVDGVHALLVPPECPEALAEALRTVLANPALALRLATAGRRLARERCSIERTVAGYASLYRALAHAD